MAIGILAYLKHVFGKKKGNDLAFRRELADRIEMLTIMLIKQDEDTYLPIRETRKIFNEDIEMYRGLLDALSWCLESKSFKTNSEIERRRFLDKSAEFRRTLQNIMLEAGYQESRLRDEGEIYRYSSGGFALYAERLLFLSDNVGDNMVELIVVMSRFLARILRDKNFEIEGIVLSNIERSTFI
ncbi:MAG: hypothetical protein Q4A21_01355 [bacterium]|nr:hypothetical protein [bacterium]